MNNKLLSDINVIPFIDIMLVLLLVFMMTAPLLTPSLLVQLPKAAAHTQTKDADLTIHLDNKQHLTLESHHRKQSIRNHRYLNTVLAQYWRKHPHTPHTIMVNADKRLAYQKVISLIAQLKKAGVTRIGLRTRL